MLLRSSRIALVAAMLTILAPVAASRAASLWTPVPTGTTDDITAVATPKAGEVVFTTGNGHIYYLNGTTFVQATLTPPTVLGFAALGMSTDGLDGVAVGNNGQMYYSTDSGHTWNASTAPTELTSGSCGSGWTTPQPIADQLYSAHFVPSSTTVYVTGAHSDVLRSTNGGHTFSEVNKSATGCVADPGGGQEFTDSAWVTGTVGYFLSDYFGEYFVTTNGLGSANRLSDGSINGYTFVDRLAVNLSNTSDAWVTAGGGLSEGIDYTTNGGTSWTGVHYNTDQTNQLNGVANVGKTVVAVGQGGDIWTSPDGVNFYRQAAADPYAAETWNAVSMVPGSNSAFAVGDGGALVTTASANQLPDTTAPTGTIAGPHTLQPGQFGSYTVNAADNPGGSGIDPSSFSWSIPGQAAQTGTHVMFAFSNAGTYTVTVSFKDLAGNAGSASIMVKVSSTSTGSQPVTKGSGGSTVTIFKKVKAGQGTGRFIPVTLATKKPRRFIVTLLTKNGKHQLATLTTTLKKGHKTVHLRISSKIKSGSYKLVVIVLTTGRHSHPVGGRIKQVFVLS
jgi:hypothetical protein